MDVGRGLILLALFGLLPGAVAASSFEIDIVEYNQSVTEGDFLNVEANVSNSGTSGFQTVNISVNGDKKEILTKNISLNEGNYETIGFEYLVEAGEAQTDSSARVYTSSDSEEVQIDISTFKTKLEEGWNYFSLPIATQSRPGISSILNEGEVEAVWRYEDGSWQSYVPEAQENPFNSFKGGEGYIVNAEDSFTIRPNVENTMDVENVENSRPVSEELQQGWNLIGHYWTEKQNSGTNYALDSLPSDAAGATYKQASDGELALTELENKFKPAEAYWQFVNTDTEYGKSESDPTEDDNCCDSGTQVEKVPDIHGSSLQVVKNRTAAVELRVNSRDQEGYLNTSEFQDKTVTRAYITDQKPGYNADLSSPNFKKICEKEGGLDEEQDLIQCNISTENLSYGMHWISWNTTREDKKHWEEDLVYNELDVIAKKIPSTQAYFPDFFQNRVIVKNDTATIGLELDYYRDEATHEEAEKYLNESEFQNRTVTKIYISDTQPEYETDLSSNQFTKVCEKESVLNENKRVTCELSTENLSSGKHWIGYNITRMDNISWKSHSKTTIRVLNRSYKTNEKIRFKQHTLEFNSINALPEDYDNDYYVDYNITVSKRGEGSPENFVYTFYLADSNKTGIGNTGLSNLEIVGENQTEAELEFSQTEPSYMLIENERDHQYAVLNLTNQIYGEMPKVKTKISSKFTDRTVTLGEKVNVSLSYDNSQNTETHLTKEEFINNAEVSAYLVDQTEAWIETGDEISTRSVSHEDFYKDDMKPIVNVENSNLSQNICSDISPSDNGDVRCSIPASKLQSGRTHFVLWKIEKTDNQKKFSAEYFTAIRNLSEAEMGENREIKINVSNIRLSDSSNGWKDFEMDTFLHNKNMTYSDNNATGISFYILNQNRNRIDAKNGYARVGGAYSVRKGYNETEPGYETIVDNEEPHYLLARANYGELGKKNAFAFKIDKSDLQ